MADKSAASTFEHLLAEQRKKNRETQLAEQIFGRNRHAKTPAFSRSTSLGASLASRVGVAKRTSSLPRSNSTSARDTRPPPSRPTRKPKRATALVSSSSDPTSDPPDKSLPTLAPSATDDGPELNIRGAAAGPYVVVASNFAPGTTAADIESVMLEVGGPMTSCKLVPSRSNVIAEMTFVDKVGAEAVISMFHNKKADGRTLEVYFKSSKGTKASFSNARPLAPVEPAPTPTAAPAEDTMDVDENAEAREAENRLREERRGGRFDRGTQEELPSTRSDDRGGYNYDYYNRDARRPNSGFVDGRYGFGSDRFQRRGGGYRDQGRFHSDNNWRGGGGGQSWRP